MVGTRKCGGITAGCGNDTCPSMSANIHERLNGAPPGACHQYGHTGFIVGEKVTRRRQLADMTDDNGKLAKQYRLLLGEPLRVGVVRHRIAQQLRLHVRGACFVVMQGAANDVYFFLAIAHLSLPTSI